MGQSTISLLFFSSIFPIFIINCSGSLSNKIDSMRYICGTGYDPRKSYIQVLHSPGMDSSQNLVVLNSEEFIATENGCVERPSEKRIFVTNSEKSAGVWLSSDSPEKTSMQNIEKIDLPSVCNSTVFANGSGFHLGLKSNSHFIKNDLITASVSIFSIEKSRLLAEWVPKTFDPSLDFVFEKDVKLQKGEYLLVAEIKNELLNVKATSECILRIDETKLKVSPADRINEKRVFNGVEVSVVQPGYSLNFYIHDGFKDAQIEYCLSQMEFDEISPATLLDSTGCKKPLQFSIDQHHNLDSGFWFLKYRSSRGSIQTDWQNTILVVENVCVGIFTSIKSLEGRGCTTIKGRLSLPDISEDNQFELSKIGKIVGDVDISDTQVKSLNILPNLREVIGGISIRNNAHLTELQGFSSLIFVSGDVEIMGNENFTKIDAFNSIETIGFHLSVMDLPKVEILSAFKNLQSIAFSLRMRNIILSSFKLFSSLQYVKDIELSRLDLIVDLSGFDALQNVNWLHIQDCARIRNFEGLLSLKTVQDIDLENLPKFIAFEGLAAQISVDNITVDNLSSLQGFSRDNEKLKVKSRIKIIGETSFENFDSIETGRFLKNLSLVRTNIESMQGLENVESIESLILDENSKLTSLDGLHNVENVSDISITESKLQDFVGLRKLRKIDRSFVIFGSTTKDFSGLENLEIIGEELKISNSSMQDFKGLREHLAVGGDVILSDNNKLEDFRGLNSIHRISGNLKILHHDALKSLAGIEGVEIGGHLMFGFDNIEDLRGSNTFPMLLNIHSLRSIGKINGVLWMNLSSCQVKKQSEEMLKILDERVLGNSEKKGDAMEKIRFDFPMVCI